MIPSDVASRLQVSADSALRQVAPAQEIADKLSGLVAGQRVLAEIQSLLPNGTYRAMINQRNLTLALPFAAKSGDAIELQVTESDGKLSLAVVAGQEPESGKPANDVTSATLSRTGQLISTLYSEARETKNAPLPLNGNQSISASPPRSAQDLVPLLKQAITQSGMFYEAHQAEWVEGRFTTASLLREPQGKLSSPTAFAAAGEPAPEAQSQIPSQTLSKAPAGAPLAARVEADLVASSGDKLSAAASTATTSSTATTASTATTGSTASTTSTAASTAQLVAPQAQPIVQQQLEALATQAFVWQGQVWPGQEMRWEIDEDAARANSADEPAASWTTRLRLVLPRLGEVDAQIRLQGAQVTVSMRTGKDETRALMRASSPALRGQFDEAGLTLASLGVDTLKVADEAHGPAGQ
jgi:hypothetical protein